MTKTLTPGQMVNMGVPLENPTTIMGIGHGQPPHMQAGHPTFMHDPMHAHDSYKSPLQQHPLRIPPNDIEAYYNSQKPLREFHKFNFKSLIFKWF